jgi:hypothetical protein
LDSVAEIAKGSIAWNHESAPDRWFDVGQGDFELKHFHQIRRFIF